jgi:phenylacetate-CoA ligase
MSVIKYFKPIYDHLPEHVKYYFGDLFSHTIRPYQFGGGREFRVYWKDFCNTENATRENLEKLQWSKFKSLLEHCWKNVEWYRNEFNKASLVPDDIRVYDDLIKIPLLTKETIKNHLGELIADGVKKEDLYFCQTGGTTGTPLTLYQDKKCRQAVFASTLRWKEMAGCDGIRDKSIYIGHYNFPAGSNGNKFFGEYNPFSNVIHLSSTNMSPDVLSRYTGKITAFKPKYIQGYASAVYLLACYMKENKIIPPNTIKAALTSSETLFPKYRAVIEEVFNCRVFDRYGQNEESFSAAECTMHRGMHIDMEKCLIEIIDANGRHITGQTGEVISTNLENFAMPFLRYRTRDLGSLNIQKCQCGKESILIDHLEGRVDDFVLTPDGRTIGPTGISVLLEPISNLLECQIIQEKIEALNILTVWKKEYKQKDIEALKNAFKHYLGSSLSYNIQIVDSIPKTGTGKFKFVISKLKMNEKPDS